MADKTIRLINALKQASVYPHPVQSIEVIETHISWVILTGHYAYKLKKPVDMGFLDFTTLEKRHHYCQQEFKLNRRLSPDYYLEVVAISGSVDAPEIKVDCAQNNVIEYAVKMKQFPQSAQLDRRLKYGKLSFTQIDKLAQKIAEFHEQIKVDAFEKENEFGTADCVLKNVLDCYDSTMKNINESAQNERVKSLRDWSCHEFEKLKNTFVQRKKNGFIRACHGDLHLRNIAIVDNEVVIFDGIEFSDVLLWNDVISEVAFLIMDLGDHGQSAMAYHFLNRYLEITGDYEGITTLSFYLVYRAMVRCMVSSIRLNQSGLDRKQYTEELQNFKNYLSLAENYTKPISNKLIITHGYSGSGKTTISQEILEHLPAIRIRSDIERKRLSGLSETQRSDDEQKKIIYSKQVNEQTYQRLLELSQRLLEAQYHVIVDAAFLQQERRKPFKELAQTLHKNFVILDCQAGVEILKLRLNQRQVLNRDASDADIDVLQKQLVNRTEFNQNEIGDVIHIDTQQNIEIDCLCQKILRVEKVS